MKLFRYVLGVFLLATLINAKAQDKIRFENIRTGGIGCPSQTTAIAYAPDNSSASLIFDRFESRVPVQLPNGKYRSVIDVPCNVFVELAVPAAYKLESIEVSYDLRGQALLDPGVKGSFKSFLMNIAGMSVPNSRIPRLASEKLWNDTLVEQSDSFIIRTTTTIPVASNCATTNDRVSMQLQHHIEAQILNLAEVSSKTGSIFMDTSDLAGGLKMRANLVRCEAPGGGGGHVDPRKPICRMVNIGGRMTQICSGR